VVVTADSGFSSGEAVAAVLDAEIDAYTAHPQKNKAKTDSGMRHKKKSAVQRMMERFDTERGRRSYSRRMGIVETGSHHTA
jgi:uncharacterized protein YaiL (DUF2058 family)